MGERENAGERVVDFMSHPRRKSPDARLLFRLEELDLTQIPLSLVPFLQRGEHLGEGLLQNPYSSFEWGPISGDKFPSETSRLAEMSEWIGFMILLARKKTDADRWQTCLLW